MNSKNMYAVFGIFIILLLFVAIFKFDGITGYAPAPGSTTGQSTCNNFEITSPGVYTLLNSIDGVQTGKEYCVYINSSDVTLNCGGYNITGNGIDTNTIGIVVENSSNVTLNGCNVYNYTYGLYIDNSNIQMYNSSSDENKLEIDFEGSSEINGNILINKTYFRNISANMMQISRAEPITAPDGYNHIGKFLNMTNTSTNSWISFNISYTDHDVMINNIIESSMIIGAYYSGSWYYYSGGAISLDENYLYSGNITTTSTGSGIGINPPHTNPVIDPIFAPLGVEKATIENVTINPSTVSSPGGIVDIRADVYSYFNISEVYAIVKDTSGNNVSTLELFNSSGNTYNNTLNTTGMNDGIYIIDISAKDGANFTTVKDVAGYFVLGGENVDAISFEGNVGSKVSGAPSIFSQPTSSDVSIKLYLTQSISDGSILAVKFNRSIVSIPSNYKSIGKTLEILADNNIRSYTGWMLINMTYTDDEVKGIDESSLRIWYYNETSGKWSQLPGGVDTENNVVWGNSTHMSIFIPLGIGAYVQVVQNMPPSCMHAISLLLPSQLEIYPGGTAVVAGWVKNTGNCAITDVKLNVTSPDCEPIEYSISPHTISNIVEGGNSTFSLTISVPENVKEQTSCALELEASALGVSSKRVFNILVRAPTGTEVLSIIKDAEDFINWAKSKELDVTQAEKLLEKAKEEYENGNYEEAKAYAEEAKNAVNLVRIPAERKTYVKELLIAIILIIILIIVIAKTRKSPEERIKEILQSTVKVPKKKTRKKKK